MSALRRAVPLRGEPRHWYPLLAVTGATTSLLVLVTALTLATGRTAWFERLYEAVLPAVLFGAPVLIGAASAALGGGLLPSLVLGTLPSLAWTATVGIGITLRALFAPPVPPADSPLWAIALVFLAIEAAGTLGGFLVGRLALLGGRALS